MSTWTIDGRSVRAWEWMPNWQTPVIERLEWMTDVIVAHNGVEQRVKLRDYPVRRIEFDILARDADARRLDAALYGCGGDCWALPIYTDGQALSAALAPGALEIPADTAHRDFAAGRHALLRGPDGGHELVAVDSVETDRLVLSAVTGHAWDAGVTRLYPVRLARLPAQHGVHRFTGEVCYGRVNFEITENTAWPAAAETLYRGRPVLLSRPNWIEDVGHDWARKLAEIGFGTGGKYYLDESGRPDMIQTHRWLLSSRESIGGFRSWLYARAGRFGAIWTPTWARDMVPAATIGAAATTIDIQRIGYTEDVQLGMNRRDVAITLANGSVHRRRITSATAISDSVERLGIDAALGVTVTPGDVASISYLALARLDTDGVELSWWTADVVEAAHSMRAIGHDV